MNINFENNTITIKLTDDEKQSFLKEGLLAILNKNSSNKISYTTTHWNFDNVDWNKPATCDDDTDVFKQYNERYGTYLDCPKNENGKQLDGAQLDLPIAHLCESNNVTKKHKK